MAKGLSAGAFSQSRVKRKGVHAKAGTSQQKQSKKYRKKYRGQGKV
jgi:hypothetical protein